MTCRNCVTQTKVALSRRRCRAHPVAPRAGMADDFRVSLLTEELREAEERIRCAELKSASLESLLESIQHETATMQRHRATDRRRLSDARRQYRETGSPSSAREAPKLADAARALQAQQAVMLAVQERRMHLMNGALVEMNERLESMHARLGEAHGQHGQHGQHGAGWPSSSSSSSHAITRRPSSAHAATPDSSARGRARVPTSGVRELLRSEMRAASGGRRPSLELRPSLRQPTFQTPLPNGALARVVSIARNGVDRG